MRNRYSVAMVDSLPGWAIHADRCNSPRKSEPSLPGKYSPYRGLGSIAEFQDSSTRLCRPHSGFSQGNLSENSTKLGEKDTTNISRREQKKPK